MLDIGRSKPLILIFFFSGQSLVPKPANKAQAGTARTRTATTTTVKGRRKERWKLERRFGERRPVRPGVAGLPVGVVGDARFCADARLCR